MKIKKSMFKGFGVKIFLIICTSCLVACNSVSVQDSKLDTQSKKTKTEPTIIAIGDMHGDFNVYQRLMLESGLMDAQGNWSGGKTIFVQTGDIPDRGPDTRKIIESLQKLEKQAPLAGGKLIPLIGNHEAMNMVGNLRYVHPGEFAAFVDDNSVAIRDAHYLSIQPEYEKTHLSKNPNLSSAEMRDKWNRKNPLGKIEHQAVWSPEGYIGQWILENQVVAKVQGYLFAHGGYSQEFTQFTLDEMNAAGRKALKEQNWSRESILRNSLGPLWYRGNVRGRDKIKNFSKEDELDKVLETYAATHVIIGHTRNEEGIRVSLNGRLFQIDTGASAAYGGVPSFLRIENGEFYAHTLTGSSKLQAYTE